jgi:hypothetical protein
MPPKRINTDDGSPSGPSHSRESSSGSARHTHAPATPSQLRQAHAPSDSYYDDEPQQSSSHGVDLSTAGTRPATDGTSAQSSDEGVAPQQDGIVEIDIEPTARSRLLDHQNGDSGSSPQPRGRRNYGSFAGSVRSVASFGGAYPATRASSDSGAPDATPALLGDSFAEGALNNGNGQKMSTTKWLANRHGVKNQRLMYVVPAAIGN